ncbi:Uncharacterised protein [Mycobacteroides abscessus subsp. abscessus]|nr:Uncharacterised protein [Mycobacteroides abscessus subsp. abscessus]
MTTTITPVAARAGATEQLRLPTEDDPDDRGEWMISTTTTAPAMP